MRIFLFIFNFILGISIFLLGLRLLGTSLESVLGFRLRLLLMRFTKTKGRAFGVGIFTTSLVQSSSIVGSTLVVLVDNGVLNLGQALGVMLGANIGTTITAQLVAFPLEKISFPLLILGIFFIYIRKRRTLGTAIVSLGAVFFGLTLTSNVLAPLLKTPVVERIVLDLTSAPWQACLAGAILTAIVQSSSGVAGLAIALAGADLFPLSTAVGLALGSNVGTVFTTFVASLGRSRASKATAYADFLFNIGGVLLVLPFYQVFLRFIELMSANPARQVAHAHTVFNVLTAVLALPFLDYLASLAWWWAGIRLGNKNK